VAVKSNVPGRQSHVLHRFSCVDRQIASKFALLPPVSASWMIKPYKLNPLDPLDGLSILLTILINNTRMTCEQYIAVHAKPAVPGDARPTAMAIVEDEGLVGKLTDEVVIITG
jgi:hypothetical protein